MSTDNLTASSVGVQCGACEATSQPDAKFCKGCGQPLYEKCAACPHQFLLTQKFCDHCGTDLDAACQQQREQNQKWMAEAVESARQYNFDRALGRLDGSIQTLPHPDLFE